MKNLKRLMIATSVFGILSVLAIGISHLALTDIYHAHETNLTQAWRVLQFAVLPIMVFHILAFATLFRTFRITKQLPFLPTWRCNPRIAISDTAVRDGPREIPVVDSGSGGGERKCGT